MQVLETSTGTRVVARPFQHGVGVPETRVVTNQSLGEAVARMFAPTRAPGRRQVGVEVELICSGRLESDGFDPAFTRDARPSFEPGGQLELSPAPSHSVCDLVRRTTEYVDAARRVAGRQGLTLDLVGVDPHHDWPDRALLTQSPRYVEMQRIFDETGPDGRRMMRLTAGLQVCVDLLPGRAGTDQWLVANLVGPALTVAFANSPDVPRSRTAIWRGVDLTRTGYDGRHLDASDPLGAYARFAAAARRFPIPDADDAAYHLSTLFPPVRPRGGYLEVRYLDTQPLARLGHAVDTVATLLFEPQARRAALDLLLPRLDSLDDSWASAAIGQCAEVADVLAIAASGMTRLPDGYLHGMRAAA